MAADGGPTTEDARAIILGTHGDPFAVLGPHMRGGTRHVTAFDPGAVRLAAVIGETEHDLPGVEHAPGVFSGPVPGEETYFLRGRDGSGNTWEVEDAYRFGPVAGELDEYLIAEGKHERLWHVLGAHVITHGHITGTHFAVWAPNARRVSVVGDFNLWDGRRHMMRKRGATGVWEIFVPNVGEGTAYKYEILGAQGKVLPLKADPVGFGSEHPPAKASIVRDITGYGWKDAGWMGSRAAAHKRDAAISIYEVHLGSWKRKWDEGNRSLSYKELATELVDYAVDMGFTHLELLPVSEFPFDGSWGYQPVGLYAPTIRFGPPHEFRDLVDAAHRAGLGVILDWVPGHFPTDAHGLGRFDGTSLYEHADPREGFHNDWNTYIFNYGRTEVQNYLVSNALYWLEEYHVDGLRVDAVASMLYRDYSRNDGEWVPNKDGGRENYEAIEVLQKTNVTCYGKVEGIMTIAEESTAYPGVSQPVDAGGLGFGFKWNMGWMNDTLEYIKKEPLYRKFHHHQMTFGLHYAFSENFILPISHDEVVHGKGSMLTKMPGHEGEKFGNLRAYYGYMWGHPGKKLLFMGQELAQASEWNHNAAVDWHALNDPRHKGIQTLVRDLNRFYRDTPAMHVLDCEHTGFQWINGGDAEQSVFSWLRLGKKGHAPVAVISNFTPVARENYRIGVPKAGKWREAINTDAEAYGGGGMTNGVLKATKEEAFGQPASLSLTLPPLSSVYLIYDGKKA